MNESVIRIENATGVDVQISDTSPEYKSAKEWRNLRQRARRNGYSLLKQVLVDHIKKLAFTCGLPNVVCGLSSPALTITMPCLELAIYKTYDDIPEVDVPCPCGDKKHQLIRYRDLRNS